MVVIGLPPLLWLKVRVELNSVRVSLFSQGCERCHNRQEGSVHPLKLKRELPSMAAK